jgi:hypothetical protein
MVPALAGISLSSLTSRAYFSAEYLGGFLGASSAQTSNLCTWVSHTLKIFATMLLQRLARALCPTWISWIWRNGHCNMMCTRGVEHALVVCLLGALASLAPKLVAAPKINAKICLSARKGISRS